ncbi:MAG: tRNA 2-thiouridine(34) synthase MnmA [Fidelibacterota bacterium]
MSKKECVLVAMSGGVDSSVALHLLVAEGYDAVGVTLKLWDYQDSAGTFTRPSYCCSLEAVRNAKLVCDTAGVPHYTLDFRKKFLEKVVENFAAEYQQGRTPNPCIRCNTEVRWTALLEYANELDMAWMATGHYARLDRSNPNHPVIRKGLDPRKDQSYVLWQLDQKALARTLFPLGSLTKPEVRKIAQQAHLATAGIAESQEICFVPNNNYREFLDGRNPSPNTANGQGWFITPEGELLAKHQGISHYTIGQRRGLGVTGSEPVYVQKIDPESGNITLAPRRSLFFKGCQVNNLNWHMDEAQLDHLEAITVLIRYHHEGVGCRLARHGSGLLNVQFDEPQFAVTPGQSAVFYSGDLLLGGGIITAGTLHE